MSWQNAVLTWALRRWVKPHLRPDQDVTVRRGRRELIPISARPGRGWHIRAANADFPKGEWIEPKAGGQTDIRRCILYLHGGGYVAMSPKSHRPITTRLAVWSDASLFALDYRLAPEHPFPAALEDAVAAYRALVAAGILPARIIVAGDSAGGGLALALLVALRDFGDSLPAAGVLFSPWTDLAATGQSIVANDAKDPMFYGASIAVIARHYLAHTPATNPLASPVYADLTGLPPLLVQVSDSEVLLDDSRRVVENARRSGVEAILQISPDLPHVWQVFARFLPEGRTAIRDAAGFVRAKVP